MKRVLIALVLSLWFLAVVGTTSFALYTVTITHHVHVNPPAPPPVEEISLWQEETCVTKLTDVYWSVDPGTTTDPQTVWIRNDGDATVAVSVGHEALPSGLGILDGATVVLVPGQVGGMTFRITAASDSAGGDYAFASIFQTEIF